MTTYQLSLLRFWLMKRDFPQLNHAGHEPKATWDNATSRPHPAFMRESPLKQRTAALREFERGCE